VKAVDPEAYLIAEIMGDAMPWLQGDCFDATMNYQFRELALDFFAESTIDGRRFMDGLVRMYAGYSPNAALAGQNLISSHDTERFLTMAKGDTRRLALAVFTQMTVPGAPGLYYGDEVGMTGGDDPGSRGAFPWHDEPSWDRPLLTHWRTLGRLRKDHPVLRYGSFEVVWQSDAAFAFTRTSGDERLLVVVNRGDAPLDLFAPVASDRVEVFFGDAQVSAEPLDVRIEGVAAWSGLVVGI
jgi:glycosidase